MKDLKVGFVLTGSFCTFSRAIEQMKQLKDDGCEILPVMSYHAYGIDTRFGKAKDFIHKIEQITGKDVICTIDQAEPIGPKKMTDVMVIAPCTGNTLAKLAFGITDTPAVMAAKSHLRGEKPLILAVATNDALKASAQNIGRLMNTKNIYFVPMEQDAPESKPSSLVAHFDLLPQTLTAALEGRQLQPIFQSTGIEN